jgi:hypothetical protein
MLPIFCVFDRLYQAWGFRTMPISVLGHADHRSDDHDQLIGIIPERVIGIIPESVIGMPRNVFHRAR